MIPSYLEKLGRSGKQCNKDERMFDLWYNGNMLTMFTSHRMETSGRHYPIRPVKKLFSAFTSMKQESGVEKRLQEASNLFFEQLADDVAAYADHAHRKTVTAEDIILLMKRYIWKGDIWWP